MANSQLPISIGSDKEGNFTYAMQLLSSSVLPFVLHSTIELNVFEILAKANDTQLSSSQIVSKMACNNPIAAANMFGLKDAILKGGVPFERMHGVNTFEYFEMDQMFSGVFNKSMFNHTTLMMKNILDKYKGFENIKTLVDVGGGLGSNLKMITTKYPTIKGTNFDVPHVVQHAPTYNVKPDHSSVISVSQFDMIMMANSPGGKERSEQEFRALAIEAGFKDINLICCVCNFWVMEFYK
ncbi:hypothetical protein H5410_032600 [Solanum commersonii]|uniref:O-methyltransferase domain-containing protein n=1 Tax=Solanum commersonii TaxID=4109 RepID=A0A9J5YQS1_SOLCO|nr:hypothetical protein H5410_032600 [Solanum commersonii]